jgi:hypothetical protein
MATDRALKQALLAKLDVTSQRLSQLTSARKAELPMSTEHAVYTIAHENKIDISKYLSKDETAEVRRLVTDLRSSGAVPTSPARSDGGQRAKKAATPKPVAISIAGMKLGEIPALKPSHAKEAKIMAEKVYPTLYLFENSVRDLIERVLFAAYGKDWWTKAVPPKVRQKAEEHKKGEKSDPWHGRRGARELDYLFLSNLWDIIKFQWKHFAPLFPDQAWVQTIITRDMNVSRRVLAHMNPLSPDDIANVENCFRKWSNQLKAVKDLIP